MLFLGSFIFLMIRRGTVHDEQKEGRLR